MSAMSIFDPRKTPKVDSPDLPRYGDEPIVTLLVRYGAEKPAETLLGEPISKEAVITSDITTEWKTYRQLVVNKPEDDMQLQFKEVVSNDMLKTLFPNLNKIAIIRLSIPVVTTSVERSFSQMKLIKTRLRSSLNDKSLTHLLKIPIESPAELKDSDLDAYGTETVSLGVCVVCYYKITDIYLSVFNFLFNTMVILQHNRLFEKSKGGGGVGGESHTREERGVPPP